MSEFSLGFSQNLIDAAEMLKANGLSDIEAQRTVLYLSQLSIEISLKSILEEAGITVNRLKNLSHSHKKLLNELETKCEVEIEVTPGNNRWISCSRLRAVTVDSRFSNATVGILLQAEATGASIYPNQIRYGSTLKHFPADVILEVAKKILKWVNEHITKIRLK